MCVPNQTHLSAIQIWNIFSYHCLKSYCVELLFSAIFSQIIQFSSIFFFILNWECSQFKPLNHHESHSSHFLSIQFNIPSSNYLHSIYFSPSWGLHWYPYYLRKGWRMILVLRYLLYLFFESLLPICVRDKKIRYYILIIHIYWKVKILPYICLLMDFIF